MSTEVQLATDSYIFSSSANFEAGQRMVKALAASTMVPREYQNNLPNCLIAFEIAQRLRASPFMVMQNLDIIHGRPSWRSQFIIASINTCGRFKPLNYELTGTKDSDERTCIAWTTERDIRIPQGVMDYAYENKVSLYSAANVFGIPILESPPVSIKMAKDEGWHQKNGSKWKTMPEIMLRYRSAAFFGRLYSPDVLMGMHTAEEVEDIGLKDVTPTPKSSDLNAEFLNINSDTGEILEDKVETTIHETVSVNEEEPDSEIFPLDLIPEGISRTSAELKKDAVNMIKHLSNTPSEDRNALLEKHDSGLMKALSDKGLGPVKSKISKLLEG